MPQTSKPTIFTVSAQWDPEANVWTGHCDDIPAAADAETLDELLAKISSMALDVLPDNHPDVDPANLFIQITALRETASFAHCCAMQVAHLSGKERAAMRFGSVH